MPRSMPVPAFEQVHSHRQPTVREWPALLVRAAKQSLEHDVPMLASALAYSAFFAIPATLLLVLGLFSLVADPALIEDLMERFGTIAPAEAVTLVEESLLRLEQQPSTGVVLTMVGLVLALWTATGAMSTAMTAINRAHEREDRRTFLQKRLVALALVFAVGFAVLVVAALLVLGPHLQTWVGRAVGSETVVAWVWWTAEWPILMGVLFGAFALMFALASDHPSRRWRIVSIGAAIAVVLWLVVSGAFALYASYFGSYNKTWGSLSAAIVMLMWLWLSSIALLFGAEVDAEVERSRAGQR
jgi:membrane protein